MDFANPRAAREMYSRAGWTIGFALIVYFINRAEYPGPAAILAAVIVLIGVAFAAIGYGITWLTTEGQRRVREQILDSLQLQGAERILSLSHELGIEAAKRLKTGKVISLGDTEANEAARETAKTAGLGDKIRFESGDVAAKLSYPDANFDVVVTSLALTGLDAERAIRELIRVVKPGGRIALHESADYSARLAAGQLTGIHPIETTMPLGLGGCIVGARKQA
jgi:SAM-dependent methyltransferase